MQKWEYAEAGWLVGETTVLWYWHQTGEEPETLASAAVLRTRIGEAGEQGWEMVTTAISELNGQRIYFKRPLG